MVYNRVFCLLPAPLIRCHLLIALSTAILMVGMGQWEGQSNFQPCLIYHQAKLAPPSAGGGLEALLLSLSNLLCRERERERSVAAAILIWCGS